MKDLDSVPRRTARGIMREAIRRGLGPGDSLPPEPALLSYFGVARGSLREAMRVLSFLGALDIRTGPGGGIRLSVPGPRVVGSALAIALQFRGATLATLSEARTVLLPAMASLAAQRRSELDLIALEASVDRMRLVTTDEEALAERERLIRIIAEAAGNPALTLLGQSLLWMSGTVPTAASASVVDGLADRSELIVEAIRRRDGDEASRLLAAGIRFTRSEIERQDPEIMSRPIVWSDIDERPDPLELEELAWT